MMWFNGSGWAIIQLNGQGQDTRRFNGVGRDIIFALVKERQPDEKNVIWENNVKGVARFKTYCLTTTFVLEFSLSPIESQSYY
jgi:hypothetical protein